MLPSSPKLREGVIVARSRTHLASRTRLQDHRCEPAHNSILACDDRRVRFSGLGDRSTAPRRYRSTMRALLSALVLFAATSSVVPAANAQGGTPVTEQDVLAESVRGGPSAQVAWLPDGKRLVLATSSVTAQGLVVVDGQIDLVDAETGTRSRLASGTFPKVSPDGSSVAFIGPDLQVGVVDVATGVSRRLTNVRPGLIGVPDVLFDYEWAADSKRLAYSYVDVLGDPVMLVAGAGGLNYSSEAHVIDVATGSDTLLVRTDPGLIPSVFWVSSKEVGYHSFDLISGRSELLVVAPGGGSPRRLASDIGPYGASPVTSPDGKTVAFFKQRDANVFTYLWRDVSVVPASGGQVRALRGDSPPLALLPNELTWTGSDRLTYSCKDGAYDRGCRVDLSAAAKAGSLVAIPPKKTAPKKSKSLARRCAAKRKSRKLRALCRERSLARRCGAKRKSARLRSLCRRRAARCRAAARAGRTRAFCPKAPAKKPPTVKPPAPVAGDSLPALRFLQTDAARAVESIAEGPPGRLAFVSRNAAGSIQVRTASADGTGERVLVDLAPDTASYRTGRVEEVLWKTKDGTNLSGLLIHPVEPKGPAPLIVDLHGGPQGGVFLSGSILNSTPLEWHLWANKGYAVFVPDYRASLVPGFQPFERTRLSQTYFDDYTDDVESGVDTLIARGIADPSRLAMVGHSYGMYVATRFAAAPSRYRTVVPFEGNIDFKALWERSTCTEACQTLLRYQFLGSPKEVPDNYRKANPISFIQKSPAPVLVISGHNSAAVQGQQFADALAAAGTTVRHDVYCQEGHVIEQPQNQKLLLERTVKWIDAYTLGTDAPADPPLPPCLG